MIFVVVLSTGNRFCRTCFGAVVMFMAVVVGCHTFDLMGVGYAAGGRFSYGTIVMNMVVVACCCSADIMGVNLFIQ